MAYRISATTDEDKAILELIRDQAWRNREDVSQTIREAFLRYRFGGERHWPDEFQHIARRRQDRA